MKTIAFFNNNGGVGKTTLVYHLAWMYAELGIRTLAVDLDPQANATSMFLDEDRLEVLYEGSGPTTVYRAFQPLIDGVGDVSSISPIRINGKLHLIPGDLALSSVEDDLSSEWPDCLDGKQRAFRVISAIWRIIEQAAISLKAEAVLIDVGPNLGALNRAALIAADHVVIPLAPDLYSLQGLRNLGPTLRRWRSEWGDRRIKGCSLNLGISLPRGQMRPLGYVVLQHAVRSDRPVKAYNRWMDRIPETYSEHVLGLPDALENSVDEDSHCLAMLKNYRSLMPMSQEAHKPMFLLRAADGAIGGHAQAVQACYRDFQSLTSEINSRIEQAQASSDLLT